MPKQPIEPSMSSNTEEFREALIDKLDDQRHGNNIVNRKLLYKDIEWIVDELFPIIESHTSTLKAEYEEKVRRAERNKYVRTLDNLAGRGYLTFEQAHDLKNRDWEPILIDTSEARPELNTPKNGE